MFRASNSPAATEYYFGEERERGEIMDFLSGRKFSFHTSETPRFQQTKRVEGRLQLVSPKIECLCQSFERLCHEKLSVCDDNIERW